MNRRVVAAIALREVAAITRSKALWLPMVLVPAVLFVLVPALLGILPRVIGIAVADEPELVKFLARLPPEVMARFVDQSLPAALTELLLAQLLAPMFLIVPVMTASLVAASAFAGERERKTLESLLYSPASDVEVFTGKCLGAWVPALVVDVFGLVVFSVVADVAAYGVVGRLILPNPLLLGLALVLAPAFAALTIIVTVFVSARTKTAQEATQLSGLLVIPIVFLVAGQASGLLFLGPGAVVVAGALVVALDVFLLKRAARRFTRPALFERL